MQITNKKDGLRTLMLGGGGGGGGGKKGGSLFHLSKHLQNTNSEINKNKLKISDQIENIVRKEDNTDY